MVERSGPERPAAHQHRYTATRTMPGGRVKVGELLRLLAEDGWQLARTRGSHRQYKHPSKPGNVTVAGKPSLDVPPGTLNAILKQAGLKKEK